MTDRVAERLQREAGARRATFVAALAGFAAVFGLVAVTATSEPATRKPAPAQVKDAATTNRVLAEVPVANLNGDGATTIIRIVSPEQQIAPSPVRTRATP